MVSSKYIRVGHSLKHRQNRNTVYYYTVHVAYSTVILTSCPTWFGNMILNLAMQKHLT